jgi:hypothetical protein
MFDITGGTQSIPPQEIASPILIEQAEIQPPSLPSQILMRILLQQLQRNQQQEISEHTSKLLNSLTTDISISYKSDHYSSICSQ